ncbi:uncharacterized protein TNCV_4072451 [Trichonephila clavipes]|uniref:Uncharacterized protein n=1 Tax=Trichonephila clavipes TaxID=2585209 RepID=A0A8X6W7U5_TRICX|nr:uncharacterized protein TNCV_4072451 [Trichonephila clavipes]
MEFNELLPAEEYREWHQFLVSLENINNIEIPRRILVSLFQKILRSMALPMPQSGATGQHLTIPRHELCAAVLLAKLVKRVVAALKPETAEIYLWSDSIIVLAWLRKKPMDLKTFVQNRVAKIQELYSNQLWRYVPSDQNPADLVSRGVDSDKLLQQKLWFNGPTFFSGDDYLNRNINCRDKLDEYNSELKNSANEQIENYQSDKAVNGFKSTGIYRINTNVFRIEDFNASTLTAPMSQAMRPPNDYVPYSSTRSVSP